MFIRATVAPPIFPSKARKLAIGASRPPRDFNISWPSIPPTMAHTGENSWPAVVERELEGQCELGLTLISPTYSDRSGGKVVRTCLLTAALAMNASAIL